MIASYELATSVPSRSGPKFASMRPWISLAAAGLSVWVDSQFAIAATPVQAASAKRIALSGSLVALTSSGIRLLLRGGVAATTIAGRGRASSLAPKGGRWQTGAIPHLQCTGRDSLPPVSSFGRSQTGRSPLLCWPRVSSLLSPVSAYRAGRASRSARAFAGGGA